MPHGGNVLSSSSVVLLNIPPTAPQIQTLPHHQHFRLHSFPVPMENAANMELHDDFLLSEWSLDDQIWDLPFQEFQNSLIETDSILSTGSMASSFGLPCYASDEFLLATMMNIQQIDLPDLAHHQCSSSDLSRTETENGEVFSLFDQIEPATVEFESEQVGSDMAPSITEEYDICLSGGASGTESMVADLDKFVIHEQADGDDSNTEYSLQNSEEFPIEKQAGDLARQRAPTKRVSDMSLNEIRPYFNIPITEASKKLKVGLTVLKRKCRQFGVTRWPHRKIKSLENLIHHIQGASSCEDAATRHCAIERLKNQKKLMEDRPQIELDRGIKHLRQASFKGNFITKRKASFDAESECDCGSLRGAGFNIQNK